LVKYCSKKKRVAPRPTVQIVDNSQVNHSQVNNSQGNRSQINNSQVDHSQVDHSHNISEVSQNMSAIKSDWMINRPPKAKIRKLPQFNIERNRNY